MLMVVCMLGTFYNFFPPVTMPISNWSEDPAKVLSLS
jgi:hypothetical protein